MKIGIIGLGKIGLPLALVFSKKFKVYGVDISEERIKQIIERENFPEPKVNEYLELYGENLKVSTNYEILRECDIVFIIVQSPSLPSGKFDTRYVASALRKLHKINPNCLAVISSTINVGDMEQLVKIHKRLCYNPEMIAQGKIIRDFENPKYIIIGAYNLNDAKILRDMWRSILADTSPNTPIIIMKPVEAEISKISLNFSFTLGITFANIIGNLCEKFNADPNIVLDLIYRDIRPYKPGLGFGGFCFPRDVKNFKALCSEIGLKSGYEIAKLIDWINNYTVEKYVKEILKHGKKKIGIFGVAYKPNVPYVTESQALRIAQRLLEEKCEVYIYDPLAEENAKKKLKGKVHYCSTIEECIEKAEIIFIGTPNYSNIKTSKKVINPWK